MLDFGNVLINLDKIKYITFTGDGVMKIFVDGGKKFFVVLKSPEDEKFFKAYLEKYIIILDMKDKISHISWSND